MVKINNLHKAVILDFEKTLITFNINWDPLRKTNSEIFEKYGFEVNQQSLRPIIERTYEEVKKVEKMHSMQKHMRLLDELLSAQEHFEHNSLDKTAIYQDTQPFLNYLRKNGLKVAILTNNFSSTVKKVFLKFKVTFKGPIMGRGDLRHLKPNPEGIKKLLKQLKQKPDHCLFIGDTDFDIETAKKTGALAIFIKRRKDSKLIKEKADIEITSLSELIFDSV